MKNPHFILAALFAALLLSNCNSTERNEVEVQEWHTLTLSFEGPQTSESDADNPFLNYRLVVAFQHAETEKVIRGFYAADGNAAESGAEAGNVWQVRFTPDRTGEWTYAATLYKGDSIAVRDDYRSGEQIAISNSTGAFTVIPSGKTGNDFRAKGGLIAHEGYFKYQDSGDYFLKVGANSPENFLAFSGFDNTYRLTAESREGEAQTDQQIHDYQPHITDWQEGDPTWQDGQGKGIIGAVNYLASKGMNAVYFLTLNIQGDGNDVWMYAEPDDFTRFDVSKLDQWEILFRHMQSKGLLLHFVLQETENETLLDNGDVGPMRRLYLQELIARFGHHPALVWNLGEENGPAPWMEGGGAQTDAQRKAFAKFIKDNDPYNHPVLVHTLPTEELKENVLTDLLGYEYLDGISLQHDNREAVAEVVSGWKEKSTAAGHDWMITMDEIGMWYTGAKADTADVNHPTLTRYVLWGSLLSGAAGVEWYFGARSVHNDLTSEDWRQRDRLWEITNHAKTFFQDHLPYWEMRAQHHLISAEDGYCLGKTDEVYALYIPDYTDCTLNLSEASGNFELRWFDPFDGGALQTGSVDTMEGGKEQDLGTPPSGTGEDWVILVRKSS